ncbi:signal peptidase I [Planctomycetota bacterium]
MADEKKDKKPLKKVLRDWAESFSVAILLALCIKLFFFEIYKIPTSSMEPTLIGKLIGGDRIIVNKLKYRFADPQRWDVFVFHSPTGENKNLIKRVTGLPGEKIFIQNGDVFIDSKFIPVEKPPYIQKAVYIQNEDISFSEDDWEYRFKPINIKTEKVSRKGNDVLSVACPGKGSLKYIRPITNFYLREGAGEILCIHSYGNAQPWKIPEASTLNSLITCPASDCEKKVDLFTLRNSPYSLQIRQEKSTRPGKYEPLPYDNTPVGDVKITFDITCRSSGGYTGCIIVEDNLQYIFVLAAEGSGEESTLLIKDIFTKRIMASGRIPFTMYAGFSGSLGFENCDNRQSVYVNGVKVYSRVINIQTSPGETPQSGLALIFRDFYGDLDNVELFRDIYYTNNSNGGMQGEHGVIPGKPFKLKDDEYFAMGDNSSNSRDSRYFGAVKRSLVMGNGLMVFPWFKKYIPPQFTDRWKVVH